MIRSLLSSFQDVVHILPSGTLKAEELHAYIKKVIVGLEKIGFVVIELVTDYKKSVSFSTDPPKVNFLYQHPVNSERPLFFIIDSVHLIKCIGNNGLKQRNLDQCMHYPKFENCFDTRKLILLVIQKASFAAIKKLHEIENGQIVKYGYGLTIKAMCPTNLERKCQIGFAGVR